MGETMVIGLERSADDTPHSLQTPLGHVDASHIMVAAAPDYMRSIAVAQQSQQERVATLLLDADRSKQRARYQKLLGNSSPEGMFSTFNSQMAEVRSDAIVCNILRKSNWRAIWGRTMRCALSWQRLRLRTMPCVLSWRSGARRMTGSALNWRDAKPK